MHDAVWLVKAGYKGNLTGVVYDSDTGQKRELTGLTVKLKYKNATGNVQSITGVVMNQTTDRGKVQFSTVDGNGNAIFAVANTEYEANLELSGTGLLDYSDIFRIRVTEVIT